MRPTIIDITNKTTWSVKVQNFLKKNSIIFWKQVVSKSPKKFDMLQTRYLVSTTFHQIAKEAFPKKTK